MEYKVIHEYILIVDGQFYPKSFSWGPFPTQPLAEHKAKDLAVSHCTSGQNMDGSDKIETNIYVLDENETFRWSFED